MQLKGEQLFGVLIAVLVVLGLGILLLIKSGGNSEEVNSPISKVSAEEFMTEIEEDDAIILDIRTPDEFNESKIAGAVNIDFYETDFRDKLEALDKGGNYKVYCNSGNRSADAMIIMEDLGFTNVTELLGGIQAWVGAGFDVVSE